MLNRPHHGCWKWPRRLWCTPSRLCRRRWNCYVRVCRRLLSWMCRGVRCLSVGARSCCIPPHTLINTGWETGWVDRCYFAVDNGNGQQCWSCTCYNTCSSVRFRIQFLIWLNHLQLSHSSSSLFPQPAHPHYRVTINPNNLLLTHQSYSSCHYI